MRSHGSLTSAKLLSIENSRSTHTYLVLLHSDGKVISVELEVRVHEPILGEGGNGTVFRAAVSPAVRGHSVVAIKKFWDMNTRDAEKECHHRIAQEYGSCRSIREMLGDFDYGGENFLMFVLVGDTLEMQWKTWWTVAHSAERGLKWVAYSRELKFIDAFLRDCAGFHKKFSHSDAHPSNICRRGDGSFVLIDWGHLRGKDGGVAGPWSSEYASPSYRGSMISPETCDVWSIGCIIIVHLSWLKGGTDAVESFMKHKREGPRKSLISKGVVDKTPYFYDGDALHSATQEQLNWLRDDFPGQVPILEAMLLIDHSRRIDMARASGKWSKTLEDKIPPGRYPCPQRGRRASILRRAALQILDSRGEGWMRR